MPKRPRSRSATNTEDDDDLSDLEDLAGLPVPEEGTASPVTSEIEQLINDELSRREKQAEARERCQKPISRSKIAWGADRKARPSVPFPSERKRAIEEKAAWQRLREREIAAELEARLSSSLAAAISRLGQSHKLDLNQQIAICRRVLADLERQGASPAPMLPAKAPELWSKRDRAARENPAEFVRRVYAQWLDKGLTRPLLFSLDEPLYRSLSVWMHRHPEDPLAGLASVSDPLDEKIASLGALASPDELRKIGLAIQNRMRRQKAKA